MFLSGVLFILFMAGCWLYCLTDAALTPSLAFPGLRKRTWITLIALTFIVGAVAWMIARKPRRVRGQTPSAPLTHPAIGEDEANVLQYPPRTMTAAEAALARHPASRSRSEHRPEIPVPIGPDDDPDFLRQLSERIRREQ